MNSHSYTLCLFPLSELSHIPYLHKFRPAIIKFISTIAIFALMDSVQNIESRIQSLTGLPIRSVENTLRLMSEGATLPFIARYRKEATGGLDETQISQIFKEYKHQIELEKRKEFVLESILEQGKLTEELRSKIIHCFDASILEDIYLPYKKRKKTRADIAKERGLEPLAKLIMSQRQDDIQNKAKNLVSDDMPQVDDVLQGARDIIAEWVAENENVRAFLRKNFTERAQLNSKLVKGKEAEAAMYRDYYDHAESLARCPSHRYLAISRGEAEGVLRVGLLVDSDYILSWIERRFIKSSGFSADQIALAIKDSFQRLLKPSIENEVRQNKKLAADTDAIKVFVRNLRQLLLAAPLGEKSVLAIDPGFRTGCKVVCLDKSGKLMQTAIINIVAGQSALEESFKTINHLLNKYEIEIIALGNGTASRETRTFLESYRFDMSPQIYIVNESGASIYSASDVAREEFPKEDVTVRGTVSIGRRLQDPLAELVKIDPKSIGVGQYQHDVDQSLLRDSLDETVVSCVNAVGINLNTASKHLLKYISGLGPTTAEKIVGYRIENGRFTSRSQLLDIPRFGKKLFEQCAGFLRVRDGDYILDNTGIHPESYATVENIAKDLGVSLSELVADKTLLKKIDINKYVNEKVGIPTLTDIMKELEKPGLDPRGEASIFSFDPGIKSISDVKVGMIVSGIVNNITNFGAFVDIGIKESGFVHISEISHQRITKIEDLIHIGMELEAKVISVEPERGRISLSLKNL